MKLDSDEFQLSFTTGCANYLCCGKMNITLKKFYSAFIHNNYIIDNNFI